MLQRCILTLLLGLLWLSAIETRAQQPTAAHPGDESFLVTANDYPGTNDLVQDAAARTGWAFYADPARHPGAQAVAVRYSYRQTAGKMRGTFRFKVADNTSPAPVLKIRVYLNNGGDLRKDLREAGQQQLTIRGTDFKAPNVYQEFSIEILKGECGFGDWGAFTTGVIPVWYDGFTVTQVSQLTTDELLPLLAPNPKPPDLPFTNDVLRIHETHGVYLECWQVREAVAQLAAGRAPGAAWTQSYLHVHPQGTNLKDYLTEWKQLYAQSVVVLDNTPTKALGLRNALMLKQFVEDGGCLVLMGDTHGLAAGGWDDSALTPVLPVLLDKEHDLTRALVPLPVQLRMTFTSHLDWAASPYTRYYHRATVRPDAQVLLASGNIPLVVERAAGKGHVIVLLLSVCGMRENGVPGMPFWEWPDWPTMLGEMLLHYAPPLSPRPTQSRAATQPAPTLPQ